MLDAKKVAAKRRAGVRAAEVPDDAEYLRGLESAGRLFPTPAQDYDDSYQIEHGPPRGYVF